jgi:hypothetical protein
MPLPSLAFDAVPRDSLDRASSPVLLDTILELNRRLQPNLPCSLSKVEFLVGNDLDKGRVVAWEGRPGLKLGERALALSLRRGQRRGECVQERN